jgi:hypothetical protein
MEGSDENNRPLAVDNRKKKSAQVYAENHKKIRDCILKWVKNDKSFTHDDIAEETGLSRNTVSKHFKNASLKKTGISSLKKMRILEPLVDNNVCKGALEGNPWHIKMFYKRTSRRDNRPKADNTYINNNINIIQYCGFTLRDTTLNNLPTEEQVLLVNHIKYLEEKYGMANGANNSTNTMEALTKGWQKG